MITVLIIIHVIACIILIGLVLIQRGRGAGLVESFAGVESMFGTKTSAFLTRTTTIMSIVFFMTCLALAILSVRQSKSLMRSARPQVQKAGIDTKSAATKAIDQAPIKVEEKAAIDLPADQAKADAATK